MGINDREDKQKKIYTHTHIHTQTKEPDDISTSNNMGGNNKRIECETVNACWNITIYCHCFTAF